MRSISRCSTFIVVLSILFSFAFVSAQEVTPEATDEAIMEAGTTDTSSMVVCDADLILNLYVAERFFGFAGMVAGSSDVLTMIDTSTINKGQYAPLFDAMMGMMNDTTMPATTMMTEEQMSSMSDMMMMDEAAMMDQMAAMMPEGTDMSGMTMLSNNMVADEPAECATLRGQLNRFFNVLVFQDMQMGMGMNMNMGADATAEAASTDMTTGDATNFSTTLAGANEVPGPGDPDGTGTAAVTIDMANTQLCYTITVQNITLPAAAGHIHRGNAGESGDVVIPFDQVPDASGNATSCVLADAALLTEIAQSPASFYVNIHTSDFPDGAVRGQVAG